MTTSTPLARRTLALTVALLAAVLSLTVLSASSASAYTSSNTGGSPGGVSPYQIQGRHIDQCAAIAPCPLPYVVVPGPVVGRSPSSNGSQRVVVQTYVQRYTTAGWQLAKSSTRSYSFGSYSSIRLPNLGYVTDSGHLHVSMRFTWFVGDTATTLGSRAVNMNGADYGCYTAGTCTASTGWVYLR